MNVYSLSKEELAIRGRDLALEFLNVNEIGRASCRERVSSPV